MPQNFFVCILFFLALCGCDSSGEKECVNLEMRAWEAQRLKDDAAIKNVQNKFEQDELQLGSTIVHDSDFIQASVAARNEIFRRVVATHTDYLKENEATKLAIEQRFGVDRGNLTAQMETKDFAASRIFRECKKLTSTR